MELRSITVILCLHSLRQRVWVWDLQTGLDKWTPPEPKDSVLPAPSLLYFYILKGIVLSVRITSTFRVNDNIIKNWWRVYLSISSSQTLFNLNVSLMWSNILWTPLRNSFSESHLISFYPQLQTFSCSPEANQHVLQVCTCHHAFMSLFFSFFLYSFIFFRHIQGTV